MKVEIFCSEDFGILEADINKFLSKISSFEIVDIKYQMSESENDMNFSAMIIYTAISAT